MTQTDPRFTSYRAGGIATPRGIRSFRSVVSAAECSMHRNCGKDTPPTLSIPAKVHLLLLSQWPVGTCSTSSTCAFSAAQTGLGQRVFPYGIRQLIKDFLIVALDNASIRTAVKLWVRTATKPSLAMATYLCGIHIV